MRRQQHPTPFWIEFIAAIGAGVWVAVILWVCFGGFWQ